LQAVSHLPQVGAFDDIVKTAEANGIPIATTNSFDPGILSRNGISHPGQDAIASATSAQATSIREVNRAVEDLDKMNQHKHGAGRRDQRQRGAGRSADRRARSRRRPLHHR
jgi:hypothetical protein